MVTPCVQFEDISAPAVSRPTTLIINTFSHSLRLRKTINTLSSDLSFSAHLYQTIHTHKAHTHTKHNGCRCILCMFSHSALDLTYQ